MIPTIHNFSVVVIHSCVFVCRSDRQYNQEVGRNSSYRRTITVDEYIAGPGNSRVHSRLHTTEVVWNLGLTREIPSPIFVTPLGYSREMRQVRTAMYRDDRGCLLGD